MSEVTSNPQSFIAFIPVDSYESDGIQSFLDNSCRVTSYQHTDPFHFEVQYVIGLITRTIYVKLGRISSPPETCVLQVYCDERRFAAELIDEMSLALRSDDYGDRSIVCALADVHAMLRGVLLVQKQDMAMQKLSEADHAFWGGGMSTNASMLTALVNECRRVLQDGTTTDRQQLAARAMCTMGHYLAFRATIGTDMAPVLTTLDRIGEQAAPLHATLVQIK